ncbi:MULTISPECIES: VOC family protein [unclassified Paenibacillus]|uniref:VOC family protein n=1 Tax=unclassified Paenibacillus TaxID=185978 RepID=UPI000955BA91|nr:MULTISPECIES: VOC family protein [unclassified Paenibacillus]ASS68881.1 VOC family protein [Paenibacillus sp. RUD330]SIR16483.1 lactoylglutathione lyase [Paenibacillus sp. RU4X]SIR21749.1 lactoylglutathione lyase [Paenibacillus sp. RU4T]
MAIRKLEHVGVMTASLEASIDFYKQVLGMEHTYTLPHTDGKIRLAFLRFPGSEETELELIEGYDDSLPAEGKTHHIAFTVDDVEGEFARIKRMGIPLRDTELTTLPNGARYFFFYGPDGELLELFQPGARPE